MVSADGHVRRVVASDSVPMAGVRVLLHEVGTAKQGPIDSTFTDPTGGFRFRFQTDSGSLYLVSTRHDGIEFFSTPLNARADRPDTGIAIVVADTTSAGPASAAITVPVRHIVIARPGNDGLRNVLDMLTLRNTSSYTWVAPDSLRPAWSMTLPPMTEDLDVGQGDISPEAVERRGDSLLVFAPLSPGEKQIAVEYHLPRGRQGLTFGFREPAERINVLIEETEARVTGFHAAAIDTQVVEGRTFRRWGGPVAAGDTIRIDFGGRNGGEQWLLLALVGVVLTVLAVAAWRYRVLAVLFIVVSATACQSETGGVRAIRIVDDAGDTTTLASPAKRVVSLMPATTELLFAIGAGDALVGRTKWCDYPPAATASAFGIMPSPTSATAVAAGG